MSMRIRYYEHAYPLMKALKRCLCSQGRCASLDLAAFNRGQRRAIVRLAKVLRGHGWLRSVRRVGDQGMILRCIPERSAECVRLINGQWLELAAGDILDMLVRQSGEKGPCVACNVHVIGPDGRAHELDLLAFGRGTLIWVEVKTSKTILETLKHYEWLACQLGIAPERAIVLWSELGTMGGPAELHVNTARVTVCGLKEFRIHVARVLRQKTRPRSTVVLYG